MIQHLPTTRFSSVGLDVGDRCVKAVQLSGDAERWSVARSCVFARPRAQEEACPLSTLDTAEQGHESITSIEAAAIVRVLERVGMSSKRVSLTMPHTELIQALVTTPPKESGAPVDRLARMELARMCRLPGAELQTACWEVATSPAAGPGGSAGGTGHEVLAVGCRTTEAERLAEAFADVGWELSAIDAAGCALARGVETLEPSSASLRLVVDIGWTASRVVAIQHGMPAYQRALPDLGLAGLHARGRSEFGVGGVVLDRALRGERVARPLQDAAEHLLARFIEGLERELHTSLGYVEDGFTERAEPAVVLTGGGARLRGLAERISTALGVPCPTPGVRAETAAQSIGAEAAQAFGLALRFD